MSDIQKQSQNAMEEVIVNDPNHPKKAHGHDKAEQVKQDTSVLEIEEVEE